MRSKHEIELISVTSKRLIGCLPIHAAWGAPILALDHAKRKTFSRPQIKNSNVVREEPRTDFVYFKSNFENLSSNILKVSSRDEKHFHEEISQNEKDYDTNSYVATADDRTNTTAMFDAISSCISTVGNINTAASRDVCVRGRAKILNFFDEEKLLPSVWIFL